MDYEGYVRISERKSSKTKSVSSSGFLSLIFINHIIGKPSLCTRTKIWFFAQCCNFISVEQQITFVPYRLQEYSWSGIILNDSVQGNPNSPRCSECSDAGPSHFYSLARFGSCTISQEISPDCQSTVEAPIFILIPILVSRGLSMSR